MTTTRRYGINLVYSTPKAKNIVAMENETSTVLDRAHLDNLASVLGADRFEKLLSAFLTEMASGIATISSRIEEGNVDQELIKAIHHAAGSAAMFGATVLRSELAALEDGIKKGFQPADDTAQRLQETWSHTETDLFRISSPD